MCASVLWYFNASYSLLAPKHPSLISPACYFPQAVLTALPVGAPMSLSRWSVGSDLKSVVGVGKAAAAKTDGGEGLSRARSKDNKAEVAAGSKRGREAEKVRASCGESSSKPCDTPDLVLGSVKHNRPNKPWG